jgi:hypothetical protein
MGKRDEHLELTIRLCVLEVTGILGKSGWAEVVVRRSEQREAGGTGDWRLRCSVSYGLL